MTEVELIKAIGGVASAVGAISLYNYNAAQTLKSRAELIDRFENALVNNRKHAAPELFRMLYGLRMNYKDLEAVCTDDDSSKIIYALKKTPGLVSVKNRKITYSTIFRSKAVRLISSASMYIISILFSLVTLLLIFKGATSKGAESFATVVVLVPCAAFLGMLVRDIKHDRMVDSLVSEREI